MRARLDGGRWRTVLTAALAVVVVLGATGLVIHRFEATTHQAMDQLFVSSTARATNSITSSTVNLQVLTQAIVSLHDREGEVDATDLRRLIGRAGAGSGQGNTLPGVEQVAIAVDGPAGPSIEATQTIGLSRDLIGLTIEPETSVMRALERTDASGLATWTLAGQLADADVALVQRMAPTPAGERRWAIVLVDRTTLIEYSLRGSNLAAEVEDITSTETQMPPLTVIDLDYGGAPERGRSHVEMITVADRTLEFTFLPTSRFERQFASTPRGVLLATGGLVALLAAALVTVLGSGRTRAEETAARSSAELASEQRRFRSLAASSPVGIAYTDLDGTVGYANHRLAMILEPGVDPRDAEVEGHPLWRYLDGTEASALRRLLTDPAGSPERALRARLHDGRIVQIRLALIDGERQQTDGWAVTVEDVTRQVRRQEELRREESRHRELATRFAHRAKHDSLTELPNRAHLLDELQHRLGETRGRIGLLFADLDGFKIVNDSLGHHAGDDLLRQVAERLRRVVRPDDLPARLGGDEFAVLVEDVRTAEQLELVAERVVEALERPFEVGERRVSISASIGLRLAETAHDAGELLRDADLAMYAAKRDRTRRWCWFAPGMHDAMRARHELENELREALRLGSLTAAYQPIVDLATGRTVLVEALARFTHPTRGPVSPAEFVPVLEEIGLVSKLGRTMLRTATGDAARWADPTVGVTINVTASEIIEAGAAQRLDTILIASGLEPARLVLELTESDVASDDPRIASGLSELRATGIRVAIDDFGTGHSSLAKLRALPVDILKIDRAFVDGIDRSARDRAYLEGIVHIATTLGLTTIAEGIETAAQLETLRGIGCDLGQGYHLARPTDDATLQTWPAGSCPLGQLARS